MSIYYNMRSCFLAIINNRLNKMMFYCERTFKFSFNLSQGDKNFGGKMDLKKLTGVLWILVVLTVFGALAITIIYDITLNTGDMEKTLVNVAEYPIAHIIELFLDVLSNIILIMVGVLLYYVFNKNRIALLGSIWFIICGIIMVIHNMGNFAVTWIARDYVVANGAEAVGLKTSAYAILLTAKWGVTLSSLFFVFGVITYCLIIIRNSKLMGWFGIFSGTIAIPAMILVWIGPQFEMLSYRLWAPMLLWQIFFGLWLIRRKASI